MRGILTRLVAIWAVFGSTAVWGQGLLIIVDHPVPLPRPLPRPAPVASYRIKELAVQAKLTDQVARVQVSQSFVNTSSVQMEVQFVFPLPYDGAIDSLTLLVDGKEFPAKLLSAKEARARYEAIVRSNRDPALLEYVGVGMFQTSVFPVPPGAERKVTLTYNQLLRKQNGLTDFLFPLGTAKYTSQAVEKVDVQVMIDSTADIKNVYSPTHPIEIQRTDGKHARISWTRQNETPAADFRLFYDVGTEALAARVITYRPNDADEGYFLLLASPPVKAADAERPKKTVLFVVDKSGSMSGKKIEQAKAALKFVLDNLREGDLFNIVAYEGTVESFRPELEAYNETTRAAAMGYVDGLYAGGGTNIHGSLTAALGQLKDSSRPNFILFLTDGLPTVGITGEAQIVAAAKSANTIRARVLPFGVGYDVNSRLLDRIARENFGQSEYVRPNEDIESHVSQVYRQISSPVMTDVAVAFEFDQPVANTAPVSRIYPKQVVDLFEGQQLVLVGRYRQTGVAKAVIRGRIGQEQKQFDFPAEFTAKSTDSSYAFVEKLWATRRIGEIIDDLDLNGKNEELVKELVELSTKHGILTPYTSFLADETSRPADLASSSGLRRAGTSVDRLGESAGRGGFEQRFEKGRLQSAAQSAPASAPGAGPGTRYYFDAESGENKVTEAVRSLGKDALYARSAEQAGKKIKLLVTPETSKMDLDKNKADITEIERFSDSYFALVQDNTSDENRLLVQQKADEQLLVKLRGKTYLIK